MEKGKLIVTKGKSGLYAEIYLENGKKMTVSGFKPTDTIYDNKEVEAERVQGVIVKMIFEGNVIFERQAPAKNKNYVQKDNKKKIPNIIKKNNNKPNTKVERKQNNNQDDSSELPTGTARAPYNFVPLNTRVAEIKELPLYDNYEEKRYTGHIKLKIKTETPLYIRDSLNQKKLKKKKESDKKNFINSDFYSPNGNIAIPGSSLRGMLRTLIEIASFGHFGFYNDSRLYFRALADVTNLKNEYTKKMSSWDRKAKAGQYKMLAGILRTKNNFDFEIIPVGSHNKGFKSIPKYQSKKIIADSESKYETFQNYCILNSDREFKKLDGYLKLLPENETFKYLVVSGDVGKKKRDWLVMTEPVGKPLILSEDDIDDYVNDKQRKAINLIYELKQKTERVFYDKKTDYYQIPCFYTTYEYIENEMVDEKGKMTNNNIRIAFGHTPMFRLPYEKKISDLLPLHLKKIPEILWNNGKDAFEDIYDLDYANAIFGFTLEKENKYLKALPGRVYFQDLLGSGSSENEAVPKVLSGPKPTTFQHYVSQKERDEVTYDGGKTRKNRNHYNTEGDIEISGNKLFWHKDCENKEWQENGRKPDEMKELINKINNKKDKVHTIIRTVKENTKFEGKIHFENLSKKELGALFFVLNLPQGCYHKLGMGKPLGLGTVSINSSLFLSNRKKRYSSLFSEWQENIATEDKYSIKEFIDSFEIDILEQIGEDHNDRNLWQNKRLQELKTLLQNHSKIIQDKFNYMEIAKVNKQNKKINEFRERPILSQPTKYVKEER